MVGRTPEWLGKKLEAREIKIAAVGALFGPTLVLVLAALSISTSSGLASIFNSGVHGFTETLYAYDSQTNNNGSAFAGFGLTNFSADLGTIALITGRFVPMFAALALGGALAKKKIVPASAGTFRTDGPTFVDPPRRRDRPHRRADDLPGAHARPDRRRADALMVRAAVSSVIAIVLTTAVFGFAYPLADDRLRAGHVLEQGKREPDRAERQGRRLQARRAGVHGSAKYFHPRPTATSPPYTAGGSWLGGDTTFANLGPTNPTLAQNVKTAADAILKLEGPYNPGLTIHDIPVDAVVTSGSGIDPDISPAYAQLQARRIAAVRHLPLATVQQLISKYTIGRSWGFFGEPGRERPRAQPRSRCAGDAADGAGRCKHLLTRRSSSGRSATRSRSSTHGFRSATR